MVYFETGVGRLGNQMFIYAFAKSLQAKYGVRYLLSGIGSLKYFKLSFTDRLNRAKNNFFFRVVKTFCSVERRRFTDLNKLDLTAHLRLVNGHSMVVGYFQSPRYFEDVHSLIVGAFSVRKIYRSSFEKDWAHIFRNQHIVALHIRRSDYERHNIGGLGGPDYRLPIEYYKNAFSTLKSPQEYVYVLLGDDKEYMRSEFHFLPNKMISEASEIIDLQILMHANTCILSNSTFAWWGGYLNNTANRTIIVPRFFLGFKVKREFPDEIYPVDWIQIDANG